MTTIEAVYGRISTCNSQQRAAALTPHHVFAPLFCTRQAFFSHLSEIVLTLKPQQVTKLLFQPMIKVNAKKGLLCDFFQLSSSFDRPAQALYKMTLIVSVPFPFTTSHPPPFHTPFPNPFHPQKVHWIVNHFQKGPLSYIASDLLDGTPSPTPC